MPGNSIDIDVLTTESGSAAAAREIDQMTHAADNVTASVKRSSMSWTEFRSMYETALDIMQVGVQVWESTAGEAVRYAEQLEKVKRLTGLTADEASRLVQVSDDLFISEQALNSALTIAGKKYDVSIDGLARMSDEYNALSNTVDKNAYAQQRFGKNYAEVIKLLEVGGDKIKQMAAEQPEGLIFDEADLAAARQYKQQIDEIADSWTALKMSAGKDALPLASSVINELNNNVEKSGLLVGILKFGFDDLWRASIKSKNATDEQNASLEETSMTAEQAAESIAEMEAAERAAAEAAKAMSDANTSMLSLIMSLQSEYDSFNEKNTELKDKLVELTQEQANFHEGSKKWNEYQAKIDETQGSIDALAAKHEEAGQRIAFSLLQAKLAADGFTDAEFQGLLMVGEQWGILDSEVVAAAQNMDAQITKMASGFQSTEFYGKGASNTVKRFGESSEDATQKADGLVGDLTVMTDQLFVAKTLQGTYTYKFNLITTGSAPDFGSLSNGKGSRKHGGLVEFAEGTDGWRTVPAGYPNDTFPIGLTSGEKFAVIPAGGGAPSSVGAGGMGMNVSINISSFLSLADQRDAEYKLTPIIERAIRNAQGMI